MWISYPNRSARDFRPAIGVRGRPHTSGGAIINILVVLIFFGLLAWAILWMIKTAGEAGEQYSSAMLKTHNRTTALSCQANLHAIRQNLQMYAMSNGGFPETRQELIDWGGNPRLLRCPDPNGPQYVYIDGQSPDMPATNVLVYEPRPVHGGTCNVLFLGGQIDALTPEELKLALSATQIPRR